MSFKKIIALSSSFLLAIPITEANQEVTTIFSKPGKICFAQTSLRTEADKYNSVMLDHYLVVPKEHHFKEGLVFVGFRLKSQPDALWLFDGSNWTKHNASDSPNNFTPNDWHTKPPAGLLQPITPTFISSYPIDVTQYIGDGEIWVGYGLSTEANTVQPTFDEMISNKRFNLIWEVGNPTTTDAIGFGISSTICLTITEMTETPHLITTQ